MEAKFSYCGTEAEPLTLASCLVKPTGARVCVIGGGGTGLALAYDLSQRGFSVTLLEKGELTSGTTGRHHGQLHCGARYAWADRNIARECYAESLKLARIACGCIEYNGGFFVALTDEEAALRGTFIERCVAAGIPAAPIDPESLARLEPRLSPAIKAAVSVPDGSFDAFRLAMMFASAAALLGAKILPWREVVGFDFTGGVLRGVRAVDLSSPSRGETLVPCDYAVNATGAWAGGIGALAGIEVPIVPAPGAMIAVKGRLVDRVVSRLRPPSDGDILVPQRGLSIIGSTQRLADSPEGILPTADEIAFLRAAAAELVPGFEAMPVHAAWAAARPLAGKALASKALASKALSNGAAAESDASGDDVGRSLSRDFQVLDHGLEGGPKGLLTIIGGKATVLRAMAEKTADILCVKAGIEAPCRTEDFALPSWRGYFRGRLS
jgi:glycerol-3-phosphate dehydrogenase